MEVENLYKIDGTILLLGETGTGKSHLAKKIHERSLRKDWPFKVVNLAVSHETLLESELFGHVRGAFTGAIKDKQGALEVVGRGTLFLDEVGELGLGGQKKLLAILEERTFTPVGSMQEKKFQGRIIAATNKNLRKLVKEGYFREDLFYRLQVFVHSIAPLREDAQRLEAILGQYFEDFKAKLNKTGLKMGVECRNFLLKHCWPGNIRELKNCLEFMVTVADGKELGCHLLPPWLPPAGDGAGVAPVRERGPDEGVPIIRVENLPKDYGQALEIFEKNFYTHNLNKFQGRITFTSKVMGISKSTLIAKAKKYGINTMLLRAKIPAGEIKNAGLDPLFQS